MKKSILAIFILAILSGCYYDKADQLYPDSATCDTTQVTYSVTIKGIMSNSCAYTGCHDEATIAGGRILSNYQGVQSIAQNGLLEGVIRHSSGYVAMPPNLPMLSSCDINKIMAWVHQGALNN